MRNNIISTALTILWIMTGITTAPAEQSPRAQSAATDPRSPLAATTTAAMEGQPADIAMSAYLYRADRKPEENAPESWLAMMRYAGMPLNKPADVNAPAIRQVLCALLWEEIRPIRQLELTWAADAKNRPMPEDLSVTTLDNQGTASSWWNNLTAAGLR